MRKIDDYPSMGVYSGTELVIRDIDEFIMEALSSPDYQEFPMDHFEYRNFLIIGDKKKDRRTELGTTFLALKAYKVWGDSIDFFIVQNNLNALIQAIIESRKAVHYIILSDSIPIDEPNAYFKMVHELRKHKTGGFIICGIVAQSYRNIDFRLRKEMIFTIFNRYDKVLIKEYGLRNTELEKISKQFSKNEFLKNIFLLIHNFTKEACAISFDSNSDIYKNPPFKFINI